VKYFAWNAEKNEQLKAERGISFEEVVFHIENGDLLDEVDHPNQRLYPHQRMFLVRIGNYAFLVPFVKFDEGIFLKTIIPNRKATRIYLGDTDEEEDQIG
jgi:uncharacterized DUF497 family protein